MQKHMLALTSLWFAWAYLGRSTILKPKVKDSEKNVSQLITSFGYPVQEFTVTTEDSYLIMIQRIPHGRRPTPEPLYGKPVAFLMTGLLCSSADFVVNMPDQSLGYILADHGFDVWLGNVRGNCYSKHLRLKRWQKRFWEFSFDEMIKYDLPAQIDMVLHETKQKSLLYLGWSQGSLIMFGLLSTQPRYNEKVRLFNAMAPVAFLGHMKSQIKHITPIGGLLKAIAQMALNGAFMAKTTIISSKLGKKLCGRYRQSAICTKAFNFFNGGFPIEMNVTRFPVYMSNNPAGSSARNMFHFAQIIRTNHFQHFDWGPIKNKRIYGQAEPPQYDITKITAPVALYWSDGDVLACEQDVRHIERLLPNLVLSYKVPVHGFTHMDFAWSILAKEHVYKKILEMMIKYSGVERLIPQYPLSSQGGHNF
uniref:Lipase n=1 Tax=Rhipicephalus appendiculatus TaxID=34631 RepID=A0A131YJZ1_RHIAP